MKSGAPAHTFVPLQQVLQARWGLTSMLNSDYQNKR